MKILCLLLSVALMAAPAIAREDPPPQDPNATPAEQDEVDNDVEQQEDPAPVVPTPVPTPETPALPTPVALGEFAMKLATSLGLPPPATGYTPESAAWVLSLKGLKIRPDLASPLTEADAVMALRGLGFKVRTNTPSRVVTTDRVELILSTFIQPGKS